MHCKHRRPPPALILNSRSPHRPSIQLSEAKTKAPTSLLGREGDADCIRYRGDFARWCKKDICGVIQPGRASLVLRMRAQRSARASARARDELSSERQRENRLTTKTSRASKNYCAFKYNNAKQRILSKPVLNWSNQLAKSALFKAASRYELKHARAPPVAQLKCTFHIGFVSPP